MFGCGWQVCLCSQSSVPILEKAMAGKMEKVVCELRNGAQTCLLQLSGYIGGKFFWNGMNWGGIAKWKNGHKSFCLFRYPFLCHLAWHYCWCNADPQSKLSNDNCTFHSDIYRSRTRGEQCMSNTTSCWLQPYMSYQPVWQPTSQVSGFLQLVAETFHFIPKLAKVSVIPAIDGAVA